MTTFSKGQLRSVSTLPPELLVLIFGDVSIAQTDLAHLAVASKQFRNFANELLWRELESFAPLLNLIPGIAPILSARPGLLEDAPGYKVCPRFSLLNTEF